MQAKFTFSASPWLLPRTWLFKRTASESPQNKIESDHNPPAPGAPLVARTREVWIDGKASSNEAVVIELMTRGRSFTVEGVPLEKLAAWCFTFNYRWRLCPGANTPGGVKFVLEPGVKPDPKASPPGG